MSTYQLRSADDSLIAQESFDDFEAANAWALEQEAVEGWTLFQQIGGEWTPARRDPT